MKNNDKIQAKLEKQKEEIRERLKRRRKNTHTKNTLIMRNKLTKIGRKRQSEEKTDIPEKGLTDRGRSHYSKENSDFHNGQFEDEEGDFLNSQLLGSSGNNDENTNFKMKSDLLDSNLLENKEDLLQSLAASEVNFVSELSQPSEMQVKRFIQNVEEGMKEYAILQENDHSLSLSNEEVEFVKSEEKFEEEKDLVVSSEENELEGLLNSQDFGKPENEIFVGFEETKKLNQSNSFYSDKSENNKKKEEIVVESNLGIQHMSRKEIKDILKRDTKITLTESGLANYTIPVLKEEEKQEDEGFMLEHGKPKVTNDYMPASYQNSVRNNKLMSELLEHDSFRNSSNYLSIKSNGVELKNSGLMMDLGIYEMYKESNLMSGLKSHTEDQILMSAIQMKDSGVQNDSFDPKNSLDKLKSKILQNGNLVDSSLFSRRELNNSKRKSLQKETQSSKKISDPPINLPNPIMSEMAINKLILPKKNPVDINSFKFAKSNWNNTLETPTFEEVENEGEIYISNTKPGLTPESPHMITDTIIPDLGINFRPNNLQDSLTNYDESQKELLHPESQVDIFMEENHFSEIYPDMTVEEEQILVQQQEEIAEFEEMMELKLSELDDQGKNFKKK